MRRSQVAVGITFLRVLGPPCDLVCCRFRGRGTRRPHTQLIGPSTSHRHVHSAHCDDDHWRGRPQTSRSNVLSNFSECEAGVTPPLAIASHSGIRLDHTNQPYCPRSQPCMSSFLCARLIRVHPMTTDYSGPAKLSA
ncbi:hypothetical protein DFH29DRAFT_573152 [Suillus ampliporus]|nr:hypothetical protein DFH29DRAFT_573152 [Suillus ampliporus]